MFREFFQQALITLGIFTLIPLGLASFFGLLFSFLQATTQIQEQTIIFLVKFLSIVFVFIFLGSWMLDKFLVFYEKSIELIVYVS